MGIVFLKLLWEFTDREPSAILINDLMMELKHDNVKKVTIYRKHGKETFFYAIVHLRSGESKTLYLGYEVESLIKKLQSYGVPVRSVMRPWFLTSITENMELISLQVFWSSVLIFATIFMLRQRKTSYDWAQTKILKKKSNIKFEQVAGIDEVLVEMKEFVDYLKRPKLYQSMGAKIPKGALLSGPPGTGKTLLVKACAGEAEVPFFSLSGSDFVEMFGGMGASRVREIFTMAKDYTPCIIFIDEIDAIGKKRDSMDLTGERDQTLNQLLTEMDGFDTGQGKVIIFAATNKPDVLDPALVRPGRFDRNIQVTLPNLTGRKEILEVHLKEKQVDHSSFKKKNVRDTSKINLDKELVLNHLSAITAGFSGADLENLTNEAAILAGRDDQTMIHKKHFDLALERVIGGVDSSKKENEHLTTRSALIKSAQIVGSWFLEYTDPVVRTNLTPRSKSKTGALQTIKEDVGLQTLEELHQRIQISVIPKLAEERFFEGDVSTLSTEGLVKGYQIARAMITSYGMAESFENLSLKEDDFRIYR
jgi:AFG3 family protein